MSEPSIQDPELTPASLPPWFTQITKGFDMLTKGLNVLGTILIVAIMLLINMDVVGRTVFHAPVSGVPEILSMSIVAIVFLQIAQTFRAGRLTRTQAVLNFIKTRAPRLHALIELVFSISATLLIFQLLSASYPFFIRSWERQTFEGTIGDFTAPIWPVKLIILIGCTALVIQLILYAISAAFTLFQKSPAARP